MIDYTKDDFTRQGQRYDLIVAVTGKVVPVIERSYPVQETAEAIRYLEEGHPRGKVVITVDQSNS